MQYEVATKGKREWKRFNAGPRQANCDSITINADHPAVLVVFEMQPFKPAIGVYRYGRVVLENGDYLIFALDDLLPPAGSSVYGDFKKDIYFSNNEGGAKNSSGLNLIKPARLVAVTSLADLLIGDFVYESAKPVVLEGRRTLDGDFWPNVTLQVTGTSEGWETIGKPHAHGTATMVDIPSGGAERFRVVLSDYKPLIGKRKYGKITFSNGQSCFFGIAALRED